MGNDLPPSLPGSSIFLHEDTLEVLKKTTTKAPDDSMVARLFGVRIYLENDPASRKTRAIIEAMEGRSCIYEGEDGELIQLPTVRDLPSLIDCPTMDVTPI